MNNAPCVPDGPAQRQEAFWTWIDTMVRQAVTDLAERAMELQAREHLQAGWNERTGSRRGYRNGHYRRRLLTPHGPLSVKVPRCRAGGLDCSGIFDRYQRRIADVDRIVRHAYLLGASTRGAAQLGEQIFGGSISHQTVSQLMRWLDDQVTRWQATPITPVYKVVYIDGMHVDIVGGDRVVMLVAGLRDDGQLDVLDFGVSVGERCVELLARLRRRGLEGVEMVVSDESGPIRHALGETYPEVPWQSCTFHRLQSLRTAVGPTDFRHAITAQAACVFRCPSRQAAADAAVAWAKQWAPYAPAAVREFTDGLTDSLQFYNLPQRWWRRTRTNNPLERLIRTLRQRLRPMGCFHDTPAIERAVLGQLARWRKIKLTHNT